MLVFEAMWLESYFSFPLMIKALFKSVILQNKYHYKGELSLKMVLCWLLVYGKSVDTCALIIYP